MNNQISLLAVLQTDSTSVKVFPVVFFFMYLCDFHINAVILNEVANSTLLAENSCSYFVIVVS